MYHQIIGRDTHRSEPRTSTELEFIPIGSVFLDKETKESLDWQEWEQPFPGYRRMQIAKIPRERWGEWLRIDVPPIPRSCPVCGNEDGEPTVD